MKKPLYVLRAEARHRDLKAFEEGMRNGGENFGLEWLQAHYRVTGVLKRFGYEVSNERVKAIAAIVTRAVLDTGWANDFNNHLDGISFSDDLEIPFIRNR